MDVHYATKGLQGLFWKQCLEQAYKIFNNDQRIVNTTNELGNNSKTGVRIGNQKQTNNQNKTKMAESQNQYTFCSLLLHNV